MIKLEYKQYEWLKLLIHGYFPYIDSEYPIEIFEGYLIFANDKRLLDLPEHLRYFDKDDESKNMGLDLPEMLEHEPFLGLIKRSRIGEACLEELKDKVRQEIFNILLHLVRKETEPDICKEKKYFSEGFEEYKKKIDPDSNYDEDIPELFYRQLGNNKDFIEYNSETNSFIDTSGGPKWTIVNSLVFNSKELFEHKVKNNILEAYRRFSKRIYSYYAFGLWSK